jgi:hypothetical protein
MQVLQDVFNRVHNLGTRDQDPRFVASAVGCELAMAYNVPNRNVRWKLGLKCQRITVS